MKLIERASVELAEPTDSSLESAYAKLKEIHSQAYDWAPPDVPSASRRTTRRMRSHVRRWIHEWDLKRLYPGVEVQTEEQHVQPTYSEDKDLEIEPESDPVVN